MIEGCLRQTELQLDGAVELKIASIMFDFISFIFWFHGKVKERGTNGCWFH